MKKLKRTILIHTGVVLLFAGYYALLSFLDATCIIREIFSFPCPTCGMTRAILSMMKLDFAGYFYYNPTAIPCAVAIFLGIHKKTLFKKMNPRLNDFIVIILTITVFAVYLVRLIGNNIP